MNIDIHAAGTWMKMIRYASPCCASVGATMSPIQSPAAVSTAAAAPNHGTRRRASGKNDAGDASLNHAIALMGLIELSIQGDPHRGGRRQRRADHCHQERRGEQSKLR